MYEKFALCDMQVFSEAVLTEVEQMRSTLTSPTNNTTSKPGMYIVYVYLHQVQYIHTRSICVLSAYLV